MRRAFWRRAALVGAVSALLLSACAAQSPDPAPSEGGGGSEAGAPAQITFLTFQSPALSEKFWQDQVAAVREKYPNLEVEIQYTPDLDRQAYAKQLLATGNLPDVIWDAPLADFVAADALLPYDPADLGDVDVPEGTGRIEGKNYSLSVGAQVIPMVYYNADEFAKLGISEPTTFDEMVSAAKKVKDAGKTPFLIGGGADPWASTIFLDGIITNEVVAKNPQWTADRKAKKVSFQDTDMKAAVQRWLDLFEADYFNDDALTLDYSQLVKKFTAGDGVMYPMGSWAGATKADFEVGVFPLPSTSGSPAFGLNYGQALAVSATTKFPAQAQAFAIALATGQGANAAQLKSDSLIPVVKGFEIPSGTAPLIQKTLKAYQTPNVARVEPFGWTQGANALPTGFSDEFNKEAQKLLLGDTSVDKFLARMDEVFDDLNNG